jgi:hypothetical protein
VLAPLVRATVFKTTIGAADKAAKCSVKLGSFQLRRDWCFWLFAV